MATISRTKTGAVRIRFTLDGSSKELYLGKISKKAAIEFQTNIESLATAISTNTGPSRRLVEWLSELSDEHKTKLAGKGLIRLNEAAVMPLLGEFGESWISIRTDVKESSRQVYRRAQKWLVKHFGEDCLLDSITPGDADDWKRFTLQSLAENTARKMSGVAKQIFQYAMRKRLIEENPFADLPTAIGAREKQFVEVSVIKKLIDTAPNAEWRLIFALARFGGVRVGSEVLALQWGDIDSNRNRIHLRQPKVEHHDGRATRELPLFHEIRPYLEDVFRSRGRVSPEDYVLQECRLTNYIPQAERIARKAGVSLGKAFFTSCRSSRETELMDLCPAHVVQDWIGHSGAVAVRHYLQVTDDHFERALKLTPELTPDNTGHGVTEGDNTNTTTLPILSKNTEEIDFTTKKGVPRINQGTPFNGPNWT